VCLGRVVLYCSNTRRASEGDYPRRNAVVVAKRGRTGTFVSSVSWIRSCPPSFWLHIFVILTTMMQLLKTSSYHFDSF